MSSEGDDGGPPPKRNKRGPYKTYLFDPTKSVPRTTLLSRNRTACEAADINVGSSDMLSDDVQQIRDQEIREGHDNEEVERPHSPNLNQDAAEEMTEEEAAAEQNIQEEPTDAAGPSLEQVNENEGINESNLPYKKKYVDKHHLDQPLLKGSTMTRLAVLLMILHMAVRHCNTQHFIEDQIKFVNTLFGSNVLDVSYHVYSSLFNSSTKIRKHYFCVEDEFYLGSDEDFWKAQCPKCKVIIDKEIEGGMIQCQGCEFTGPREKHLIRIKFTECQECKKQIDVFSANSDNYFITLPLRDQIEELLKKPGLKLVSRAERVSTSSCISDVFDGEMYKKLCQPGFPLANENALTAVFNTDGVAVHKSTRNTMWPILMYLNEVVPEQRFKRENLIVAGLWFGKSAPNMSLYLKPFMESMLDLSLKGVKYKKPGGMEVECPVFLLTCSVDSVAKPKLLCQKQFNARMGCLYCTHPNDSTLGDNNSQRYYDQSVNYPLRSEENIIADMLEADRLQRAGKLGSGSVNGFLGISILTEMSKLQDYFPCSSFHMLWGVVIDYMHAALEGVTADLFNIYENTLSQAQLKILDENIQGITPPQGMTRRPRSFLLRTSWKAKEFRAMILFYALPCFQGILPQRDFSLLKHYVFVLHTLLSDNIPFSVLSKAASALSAFTEGYQKLYGLQNVTYNLHILRHLIDMVIKQGPLWCYSNFVFESANGYLLNLVRGTKSVINEIAKKHVTIQTAGKFIQQYDLTPEAVSFCSKVINCKYAPLSGNYDNIFTTGSESIGDISKEECEILIRENIPVIDDQRVQYYNRVISNGTVYTSKSYTKSKVYDDSCVALRDGAYALIDKIVKSAENKMYCLIKPIRISQGQNTLIPTVKACSYDVFDSTKLVSFQEITRKCMFITVREKNFVCTIPNFYERD